jgi:peroxiredoxin
MRTFARLATLAAVAVSAIFAQAPIRKAPEFSIVEPSGKQTLLSSYKGKVCVIEFLFTTCPHCQKESQMLTKLYKEMAPRGLQVVGVAVNDNASVLIPAFAQQFDVPYPMGYSTQDAMKSYMGISDMERWVVPQVVVIDRKGMVRAQSPYQGDPNLQTETYMHNLLDTLLKEGAATSKTTSKTTATAHPAKPSNQ